MSKAQPKHHSSLTPASQRRTAAKQENIFRMEPLEIVYFKEIVRISFEPLRETTIDPNEQDSPARSSAATGESEKEVSIIPVFNLDRKYYTSSFIVPYEAEESDEEMRSYHETKVNQSQKKVEAPHIMVPKPKSKNQYCAVCRFQYEDYLSHIQGYDHKKSIKRSRFNADIDELCRLVNDGRRSSEKDGVMTRSAKRRLDSILNDHPEVGSKGSKKRKSEGPTFKFSSSRTTQEKDETYAAEGQTPFTKRGQHETTAKSIYSVLD